ncbi:MAG: dethiobiotin synthase [Verrucomicrobiota bacterium]
MIGSLFLTGTDTDVGKTYAAALLLRALRASGKDAVGMKPICCGERSDAEMLHEACDGAISLNQVNPVWLRTPAAPYTAALIENRPIDLALVRETFGLLRQTHPVVIVEGVGGWRVPITERYFVSDLAVEMGLPVAVVVANKLGALNHTLLTVESIRASGLICAGIIFNNHQPIISDFAASTNRAILESLLEVPILFEIEHDQSGLDLGK